MGAVSPPVQTRVPLRRYEYSQLHMGVRARLAMYAPSEAVAERASRAAFARFAELEQVMSDYRPSSELMQLCAAPSEPRKISQDLYTVLAHAQEVARLSEGAFDVTCGPLVRLWREMRRTRRLPLPEVLAQARARVGYQKLELVAPQSAWLKQAGMQLDLGGIAKGYACDEALEALAAEGVDRALVEAGGDLAASGPPPGKLGWVVSVQGMPKGEAFLARGALSTSGDLEQSVRIGGKRYSHILDPRTGIGLNTPLQVSVWAPRGILSDSLATAVCILGEAKAKALLDRYGAKARFSYPLRALREGPANRAAATP